MLTVLTCGGQPARRVQGFGNPDWGQRLKGVELALAHLASLAGESGGRENLPAGVTVVYPLPR
jgi:hypothetical protein